MDTFAGLIDSYGYFAVFVGALLEGETVLVLAGFAAQRGFLELPIVIGVAFVGGFFGDQLFFYLGRHHGHRLIARFPRLAERILGVDQLLSRYHAPLIFSIRFMYGLRIVGPIAFGMGAVTARKFFLINLLGALVWALLIAGAGYLFGQTLERLLSDIKQYELLGMAAIVGACIAIWLLARRRAAQRVAKRAAEKLTESAAKPAAR